MSTQRQPCARWGCKKSATSEKPLCYDHWKEWDSWELEECTRCHWFCDDDESAVFDSQGWFEECENLCDQCLGVICIQAGKPLPWFRLDGKPAQPENRPIRPPAKLERTTRYVYILKLADNSFYVGQTTNLAIRMQEHRDGLQRQTRGKNPRLVYFELVEGVRDEVNALEADLARLAQSGLGRRHLREMIERFRAPLKLLDLGA
ncbi:MAG: GIY-YIG nuclease family protein [Chloroflexi bacterium]|nr:GIY-YIG nuclease family protein [Chloroflexota bacterium]